MTEPSITNLCKEIREDLLTLPAVRTYQDVPDSVNEWPAVIVLPTAGLGYIASHGRENGNLPLAQVVTVQIEVHVPTGRGLAEAMDFLPTMADALPIWLYSGFDTDRFNGTMITGGNPQLSNNSIPPISWEIGPSQWDSTETVALILAFQVTFEQEVYR